MMRVLDPIHRPDKLTLVRKVIVRHNDAVNTLFNADFQFFIVENDLNKISYSFHTSEIA